MSWSITKTVGALCELGYRSSLYPCMGIGVLPVGIARVAAELIFLLLRTRLHEMSVLNIRVNWIRFSYEPPWGGMRTTNFSSSRLGGFGRKQANVYNFVCPRSPLLEGITMAAGPI